MVNGITTAPMPRRLIALAAAYLLALAALIASFADARMAAAAALNPATPLCHSQAPGTQAPAGDQSGGQTCADFCCIGCLMQVAALPPAPQSAAVSQHASGETLRPFLPSRSVPLRDVANSHRSRAPPGTA